VAILEVKNLTAGYGDDAPVIDGLSFDLAAGETLGICGPSGCGKTTVIWAVLGMLRALGGYTGGEALYGGRDLLQLGEKEWRALRWRKIALVPQSSMSALNPVFTIGRTFRETQRAHKAECLDFDAALGVVGLPPDTLRRYPHELSGGMRQRASIALAMLLEPEILILDEATTGLDVIIEAEILRLLREIQHRRGLSILFVSHDRRVTAEFCHRRIFL